MKTLRLIAVLFTVLFATLAPRPAEARVEVSFDYFYDSLSPYGDWIQVGDYGYGWRPVDVDRDWAPYSDGYWAFTDAGWTWVSYEDFGGIVYHYGRWIFAQDEGWCWIPDYEWAPAWVSWRHSDDYVGWAPLPPEARWRPEVGLSVWVDRQYDIGPGYYNFCRARDFGAPVLRPVIVNRVENVTIIRRTVNVTNITYNTYYGDGDRRLIYNGGPNFDEINRRSARRVPALKLVQNVEVNLPGSRDWDRNRDGRDRDNRRRNFNARAEGNQLIVTAPVVRPLAEDADRRPQPKRTVAAEKVSRGWNGVKNDEVRKELRQEMQRQTRGLTPETAPAKAVAASDLRALPEKADPQAESPVASRERPGRGNRPDRTPDGTAQPAPSATTPAAPTAAAPPTEGNANDRQKRDDRRGETSRGTDRPVAGQPASPSSPAAGETNQRGMVPNATPVPPQTAQPGENSERGKDGRGRADRTADDSRKGRDGRSGEMTPPAADAAAKQAQAEAENARRDAKEAATKREREAEMQRGVAEQQKRQQAAERQKMQAQQENAGRQQAEAAARQKQMEAQRDAEGRRQRQREEAAAGERQRMQAEQGRAAKQQVESAQRQQMEIHQRAAQAEAARQQGARRQAEQQSAEKDQRRQMAEQHRAAENAQRQQAERGAEQQRRQMQAAEQQSRRGQEAPQQRNAPEAAQRGPAAPENEKRGRGRDGRD